MVAHETDWDVEVIDENNYRSFGPRDDRGRPDHATLQTIRPADVVGLYGGLSSTVPRLFEVARFYKEAGATVIAGGQHFAGENTDDALKNGIDYVVRGEGEYTTVELLGAIESGADPADIPGLAFRRHEQTLVTPERPPMTDFDSQPLTDFSLLRYAKVEIYPVCWARGCGMDCEFCTVKGKPRAASPQRVFKQIATLLETCNARSFFIVDDLFGHRRTHAIELCRMLAAYQKAVKIRLDITVQIRLDRARDTELLTAMRQAGINTVCIGFESPIAEELQAMNKKTDPEQMLALTRCFHKAGFMVHGMFIFAYPLPEGCDLHMNVDERIARFRRFINKARLDTIQVLLPVPLPGTEMTERLKADRRVFPIERIGWEYYDGNFPLFLPDAPLTPEQMQMAIRRITGRFYRLRNFLYIARNVLLFPAMMATVWDMRAAWERWYRIWRKNLIGFGGHLILRNWIRNYRKSAFASKLQEAKASVAAAKSDRNP